MGEPSRMRFFNAGTDLIFDYDISEVIRKIAHGDPVLLLPRVPGSTRVF